MASGQQFGRVAKLIVAPIDGSAGVDVSQLRISFSVKKTSVSAPNKATIQIYNLAKETRERIKSKKQGVILHAGYEGFVHGLASGVIQRAEHELKAPEVITTLEVRDGGLGLDDSEFCRSYPRGTPRLAIVKDILGVMPDVSEGSLGADGLLGTTAAKVVFSGSARRAMDKCATAWRFEWSVQDGVIQASDRTGSAQPQYLATVLSKDAGMIGSPTITDAGCKVMCLLNPQIKPGGWLDVRGDFCSGYFKALTVEHKGDTWEGDWSSEIEAQDINKKIAAKKKGKRK